MAPYQHQEYTAVKAKTGITMGGRHWQESYGEMNGQKMPQSTKVNQDGPSEVKHAKLSRKSVAC